MDVERIGSVDAFDREAGGYLAAREAEHNLILGLVAQIRAGEYAEPPPLFAAVRDDGRLVACALQTPPHRLIVSMPAADAGRVAAALIEALHDGDAGLPGVLGPPDVADAFARGWCEARGLRPVLAMSQRIYRLDRVTEARRAPGRLRSVAAGDRDLVARWMDGFIADTGEAGPGGASAADRWIAASPDVRALYLWEGEGAPVSMAGVSGFTPHGVRVGAVYTPPEQRRRGYASALVAAVSRRMLDSGREFLFLFTDLANSTSNHIYQAIGYRPVGDVHAWDFAGAGEASGAER